MPAPASATHPDAPGELPSRDGAWTLLLAVRDQQILGIDQALASALHREPQDLSGRPGRELFHPQEWAAILRRLEDAMLLGCDTFGAVALRSKDGSSIWVDIQAAYRVGQQLELRCRTLEAERPGAPSSPGAEPTAVRLGGPAGAAAGDVWPEQLPAAAEWARLVRTAAAPSPGGDARPAAVPRPSWESPGATARLLDPAPAPSSQPPQASPQRPPTLSGPSVLAAPSTPPGPSVLAAPGSLPGPSLVMVMAALESAGVAAVAVAADGTVLSATVACEALFGIPVARLRGRELVPLLSLPPADGEYFERARQERRRHTVRAQPFAGHGPVTLAWLPETTPGAGYAILVADSQPVEASQAERVQTRLVSFVAHDVREVLANLYCGLRLLSEDLPAAAPQRPTVDRLLVDSSRACRIVDDVLAVSRPGRLSCVPLEMAAVLHQTLARYRPRAAAAGIEVRESLTPGLYVNADLSGLERAFGNLIENAIEATPLAGTLAVHCAADDRERPGIRVCITDTGMGIPPAIQPNLFEPFVSGKARGTGLGLASTRRIVADHEGAIDFETEVGRGTTFHVWLPRLEGPPGGEDQKEVSE